MSLTVTVIIPTMRRPGRLRKLLETIDRQSRKPEELFVIDAAPDREVEKLTRACEGKYGRVEYFPFHPGLTQSRNLGIKNSKGDIVVFLDDDLELHPDFIKEIIRPFEEDREGKIGGVTGNVLHHPRRLWSANNILRWALQLPYDGNGFFRWSGACTIIHGAKEECDVEFLPGGLTAWRREVFRDEMFDENLPGLGLYEDVDFSYRSSRTWRHVYVPKAVVALARPESSTAREADWSYLRDELSRYWYVFRKNQPKTPLRLAAFLWHQFGVVIRYAIRRVKYTF